MGFLQQRKASAGNHILETAAAYALRGEHERARELVDLVLDADRRPVVDDKAAMVACLALGDLDRAAELGSSIVTRFEALPPLIVALAQAGRTSEALELLRRALGYVVNCKRLAEIAPAVLALAPDQRATATSMLDTWAQVDASLDTLLLPQARNNSGA